MVGCWFVCLFAWLFVCFGDSTSDSFTSFKIIFIILHCPYKLHVVMHGHQFFHVDLVAVSSSFHLVFQSCLPTLSLLSHLYIFFPYLFFWGTTFGCGVDVCLNAWVARKVILVCRKFAESHQNVHYRIVLGPQSVNCLERY